MEKEWLYFIKRNWKEAYVMMTKRSSRCLSFALAFIFAMCTVLTAFAKYDTITYQSHPDTIRALQSALKKKRFYKGKVDGVFGPATRSAVYRFQNSVGLKADGKPGDRTLTALYDGTSAINEVKAAKANAIKPKDPRSLHYGVTGSRVRSLQRALKSAGVFKGAIDGVYGDMTELAVRKFQTKRGLHVDGIAGVKTIKSLNNAQKKVKLGTGMNLTLGSRGEPVESVQRALNSKGIAGNSTGDVLGVYGPSTTTAVKNWQKSKGYEETGIITNSQYNQLVLEK